MTREELHQELYKIMSEIDDTLNITSGHQITSAPVMTDRLLDIRNIVNALLNMEEIENG